MSFTHTTVALAWLLVALNFVGLGALLPKQTAQRDERQRGGGCAVGGCAVFGGGGGGGRGCFFLEGLAPFLLVAPHRSREESGAEQLLLICGGNY